MILRCAYAFGVCLLTMQAALMQGQSPRTRVDTVLLARDLDGDRKLDYVVRESSDTTRDAPRPARLAIYVGAKPQTQPAAWASPWNELYGSDATLADVIRVDGSATLLELDLPADDVLFIHVLLVERGAIRELVSHAVGMDDGFFRLEHPRDRIAIDATPRTLVVEGKEIDVSLDCSKGRRAQVRLRFDRTTRSFVAMPPRCVRPKP